jgi:hypothetical protein
MMSATAAPPNRILLEAIAMRTCITATYNGGVVLLAPHILYTRHDELFIDAVTVEREGRPPREVKLGTFKLAGLKDIAAAPRPFEPFAEFDAQESRYAGTTLFAVN